jgi:hypothetical protein
MTLLFWRFTSGLYYELISVPRFANEFGEGFQSYVGEVTTRIYSGNPRFEIIPEHEYWVGKHKKRTVDWIITDQTSALFLECKAKRVSLQSKTALTDFAPLEKDINSMASAIVQVYKTIGDYDKNSYPCFPFNKGRKIYPAVATLENWWMAGKVMHEKLAEAVRSRLVRARLPLALIDTHPYSVWAIQEMETGFQIVNKVGIQEFMDGKLNDPQMSQLDLHTYMIGRYKSHFPMEGFFSDEYDKAFFELLEPRRAAMRRRAEQQAEDK